MLNEVVANALDAVVSINGKNEIIFWNFQAEVTFGWTQEEIVANKMKVSDIIPDRYRAAQLEGMRNYLATGEGKISLKRLELSGLHKHGHEFPLEITIIPVKSEQPMFYAFLRDITDRVSRHQDLLEVIRERDFFISVASHELKTPLTSLKLRIQLLDMLLKDPGGLQDQQEINKSVSVCSRQVDKLATMCNDLLDLAKIQSRKMEVSFRTFRLRNLLTDILERMENEVKSASVAVTLDVSDGVEVRWDMSRIEQVFVNLISNTLKYAPGKSLDIKCDLAEELVRIQFADSGPGINEENQKRLFNPFTRCTAKYSTGLGLGLFICKSIIEQHRGKISVESRINEGTKFILELPRVVDSSGRGKSLR